MFWPTEPLVERLLASSRPGVRALKIPPFNRTTVRPLPEGSHVIPSLGCHCFRSDGIVPSDGKPGFERNGA